jgi:hypothetical protein
MTASSQNAPWPVDVLTHVDASTATGRFLIESDGRIVHIHVPTWRSTRGLRRRLARADRGLRRFVSARLAAILAAEGLELRVFLRGRELARLGSFDRSVLAGALSLRGVRIRPFGVLLALLPRRPSSTVWPPA